MEKIMPKRFRSSYDRVRVFSEAGSPIDYEWKLDITKDGREVLVHGREINIYDEIQSHAESVDINVILDRYANGEILDLKMRDAMYADVTEMPTNLADVLRKNIAAQNYFNALPLEERAKFDYDYGVFLASADKKRR